MEYERKYLERCFHIYTSRYFHTAITYKLQNVFQYSVSIQYNYFDTVFHTMYFNTAQLCLWPMTFFGLTGRICPLLVHATSRLPFILHLSLTNLNSCCGLQPGEGRGYFIVFHPLFLCTHFFIQVLIDSMYLCISFCAMLRFFNRLFWRVPPTCLYINNCALSILFCVYFVCMCVYSCVPHYVF